MHTRAKDGSTRGQLALATALLALAVAAWLASIARMAGMDGGPGTDPGTLGFFLVTWLVMMVAMMTPSITPTVLSYRTALQRLGDRGSRATDGALLFLGGYLAVWAAAGLLGYALLEAGRGLAGGTFAWHHAGRWAAAGVLATAAGYQLTPLKRACLARCRSRPDLHLRARQASRARALREGMEHGAWCLGCCWALMAALFALGAMSVAWMVLIAALIAVERLLAWRTPAVLAGVVLLGALALEWRVRRAACRC